ncbi:potassium channel family protein [Chloroflexota bacterium]
MGNYMKRIQLLFSLPIIIIIIGTSGFMILERMAFIDALYFTIVTISTVGYGDLHPTSTISKLFGIFIIIVGIGTFLTIVTTLTQLLVQRGQDRLRNQRLNMIIGVFFTEVGNQLLHLFTEFDSGIGSIREDFKIKQDWSDNDFAQLRRKLRQHEYTIDPKWT